MKSSKLQHSISKEAPSSKFQFLGRTQRTLAFGQERGIYAASTDNLEEVKGFSQSKHTWTMKRHKCRAPAREFQTRQAGAGSVANTISERRPT